MKNPSPLTGEGQGRGNRRASRDELLKRAKAMRRSPTDAEAMLWRVLRAKRLAGFKFKRQERIDNYIVDFVCLGRRLVIEADGGQHSPEADGGRDRYLKEQGFRILRFWNNDILNSPEGVSQCILDALQTPLPSPLPQGERAQNSING